MLAVVFTKMLEILVIVNEEKFDKGFHFLKCAPFLTIKLAKYWLYCSEIFIDIVVTVRSHAFITWVRSCQASFAQG